MQRPYRSTRRAEQSAQTRRAIVETARRLFAESGYGATSLERIAQDAGVAVQTIYATFRTKVALLAAVHELVDEQGGVPAVLAEIRVSDDPERLVGLAARITRHLNDQFGDIIRTIYFVASGEESVAAIWAEGMRRHRLGTEMTCRRLADLGALRAGLDAEAAADVMDALTSPQMYFHLVDDMGWSYDRSEAWIAAALRRLLLPA